MADPIEAARRWFTGRTGIIGCVGGRNAEAEVRLKAALQESDYTAIRSTRRALEAPGDNCWLASDGWRLSTALGNEVEAGG